MVLVGRSRRVGHLHRSAGALSVWATSFHGRRRAGCASPKPLRRAAPLKEHHDAARFPVAIAIAFSLVQLGIWVAGAATAFAAVAAPVLTLAVSRKNYGGVAYDVPLPFTGNVRH